MRVTNTKATAAELTATEKRVLLALKEEKKECDQRSLSEKTDINEDAVMQTAFMLAQKGLCEIKEEKKVYYRLTEEGREYVEKGLPERRALDFLMDEKEATVEDLKNEFGVRGNIAINWLLKKKWARIEIRERGRSLIPASIVQDGLSSGVDEEILKIVNKGETEREILVSQVKLKEGEINGFLTQLISRNLLETYSSVERKIMLTEAGKEVLSQGISIEEEIAQLTPELLRTGSWKGRKFKRYDVNLPSKETFPAKIHPYQRILDRMRRIFTEMGFTEIKGELVQSAFWNFDALFVPQDHPARDMQDTFYLATRKPIEASEGLIRNVKQMHEHGGSLNSTGWGGEWRKELGEELLLRTHTTAITLSYLASHPEPPVKVFCIDRVYRRETIDATHIPEFDQLEGIVMDRSVTFSNLLGLLATFYKKMGFPSIRFRPGYFPYTEPSVEVEVYMPERGWLELGGAGVFREEVTNPIGVKYPVLAWGLGIGRLAMISLGLTDIRDLYQSDMDWLRKARVF
ncbi:MAG: phenylalanine--tRNA ligase subunit alpha [Candidatus Syntrophoarchaeum sp.]|nr:phenylalanine--tRNA ligase subunit alpha [Candidatus Syntrophoarchaeum sp.]